jgi:hypothetical protein
MNSKQTIARAAATAERIHIAREAMTPAVRGSGMLDVVLVPWNEPATVTDDGRNTYTEVWEPGSLVADSAAVPVYGSHVQTARGLERGPLIGVARDIVDMPDGLHATIHLATDEGRRVHELAALGVGAAVSIEADTDAEQPVDGTLVRSAANPALLTGVATILPPQSPAYTGAVVTAVRAAPETPPPDGDDPDGDEPELDADGNPVLRDSLGNIVTPAPAGAGGEATGRAAIAELVRGEVARYGLGRQPRRAVHPLARFNNPVELLIAARNGTQAEQHEISRAFQEAYAQHREIARALVNQITPDNPGVMPPTWLSTIFGVVDSGRPGITAMGGPASAGDTGMDIYWPYTTVDLTTLVAEQLAQKTDIQSVKVSFLRGQATLKTYAGGSDVSYQLQRRSSPSYMAAYNRLLQTSYGLVTEIVFDAALVAGAGATVVYDPSAADADGSKAKAFLFAASAKVKKATGTPASAALVSSDVYAHWGGQPWLQPPMYGTQNVPGTAAASTLRINISGLEIVEAVGMAAGNIVVSNPEAARWFEDGPFLVTAEDVAKLGTDAAIWGMGITGLTVPTGVVKASATQADATRFEKDQEKAAKEAAE